MRVIIAIILILGLCSAATVTEKEGLLHIEADSHPESPIALLMKGVINPQNEGENNVQTFFRLAEQLIPLAESAFNSEKPGHLQWARYWCYGGTGELFSLCVYVTAELWVGWRVEHEGITGQYNLTYTPFTYFRAGGNASAASYPAEVAYGAYFQIVDIRVPVNLLLAQKQICYSATFAMAPTEAYTSIKMNLLQCLRSVPDLTPWECDRVQGAEFKHLEFMFTNGQYFNILPYSCINF